MGFSFHDQLSKAGDSYKEKQEKARSDQKRKVMLKRATGPAHIDAHDGGSKRRKPLRETDPLV